MMRSPIRRVVLAALVLALVAPLAVGVHACTFCNSAVCSSWLSIGVSERDRAPLSPGTWTFELVADDDEPLVSSCVIGQDARTARCDAGELAISPQIFDGPENPYTRFQIDFRGGNGLDGLPAVLEISIAHDEILVFEGTFEPDYRLAEPERCDPDCHHAHLAVVAERS